MKRVVTFKTGETKNQHRFEVLYGAIVAGGQTPSRGSGIEVLRKEARILDALDAISDPPTSSSQTRPLPNGEPTRAVQNGCELVLAQPEHELLKKRLEEGLWSPRAARDVVDCIDWFSAAPEQQD